MSNTEYQKWENIMKAESQFRNIFQAYLSRGCRKYRGCNAMAHPDFDRSVNPISTKGGRLCPPHNYQPRGFSDLSMTLFFISGVGVELINRTWTRIYHYYYQWVPIVLTCYLGLFYLPRWIWKMMEGGRMKGLCDGLNSKVILKSVHFKNPVARSSFLSKSLSFSIQHQLNQNKVLMYNEFLSNTANLISKTF